jgi:RES domain-containing protein
MLVYRITGRKYATDLSGSGSAIYGGRWNKKGTPVLYTSESKELALLETIVHTPPMFVPKLDILVLELPDSVTEIEIGSLPLNWSDYPAPAILAEIAGKWIKEAQTIALKVPSCIIHSSHNYILNCRHPEYQRKVKVTEHKNFHFDLRLIT